MKVPVQISSAPTSGRRLITATALLLVSLLSLAACTPGGAVSPLEASTTPDDPRVEASAEPTLDPDLLPEFELPQQGAGVQRSIEMHTVIPDRPRMDIIKYLVQRGDTLFGIADRFGIDPETVLWGNWDTLEQDPHTLQPGQELYIPPVDGVLYEWEEGKSLNEVADFFHASTQEIIEWPGNHIPIGIDFSNPDIDPGQLVLIPDGRRDPPSWQMVSITRSNPAVASILGPGYCGSVYSGLIGDGFFDWPTSSTWQSGYGYTPGLHEAIDLGGSVGNAIYAADDGVIVYSGWNNYGYGNVIVIDHGTGWQTLYAHLDTRNYRCGDSVTQGTVIGTMGTSGNSTGAHLHFEMRSDIYGRVNPYNFLP
jgi:murein DD-endopeptidase MepM/ murein hydrolase activator NlpD